MSPNRIGCGFSWSMSLIGNRERENDFPSKDHSH